jgi:hypothetical protein
MPSVAPGRPEVGDGVRIVLPSEHVLELYSEMTLVGPQGKIHHFAFGLKDWSEILHAGQIFSMDDVHVLPTTPSGRDLAPLPPFAARAGQRVRTLNLIDAELMEDEGQHILQAGPHPSSSDGKVQLGERARVRRITERQQAGGSTPLRMDVQWQAGTVCASRRKSRRAIGVLSVHPRSS